MGLPWCLRALSVMLTSPSASLSYSLPPVRHAPLVLNTRSGHRLFKARGEQAEGAVSILNRASAARVLVSAGTGSSSWASCEAGPILGPSAPQACERMAAGKVDQESREFLHEFSEPGIHGSNVIKIWFIPKTQGGACQQVHATANALCRPAGSTVRGWGLRAVWLPRASRRLC